MFVLIHRHWHRLRFYTEVRGVLLCLFLDCQGGKRTFVQSVTNLLWRTCIWCLVLSRDVYIQINPNIKCNWSKFWKLPKIEYCWIILDLHMWRVLPSDFKFLFQKRLLASDFKFLIQNRINYYYYFWKLFYCDYIIIVLIWIFYNFPRKKKDFLQL